MTYERGQHKQMMFLTPMYTSSQRLGLGEHLSPIIRTAYEQETRPSTAAGVLFLTLSAAAVAADACRLSKSLIMPRYLMGHVR